jgi:hypothetical protein
MLKLWSRKLNYFDIFSSITLIRPSTYSILGIPISCICCPAGLDEIVIHRFYQCECTRRAWHFALTVLYTYLEIPPRNGKWPSLTWQQCLLGSTLPRQLQKGRNLWSLFRGSVTWLSWLDRNALCFRNEDWPQHVMEAKLWELFLDHGRTTWLRSSSLQRSHPARAAKALRQFDQMWMLNPLLGTRAQFHIQWNFAHP